MARDPSQGRQVGERPEHVGKGPEATDSVGMWDNELDRWAARGKTLPGG